MNKDEPRWKTKSGKQIPISEMKTSHIENSLAMLKRAGYVDPSTVSFYISGPTPNGEGAMDLYDQEFDAVMDAPTSRFVGLFEEELKRRIK